MILAVPDVEIYPLNIEAAKNPFLLMGTGSIFEVPTHMRDHIAIIHDKLNEDSLENII